MERFELLY